jgi:hypothetical protein
VPELLKNALIKPNKVRVVGGATVLERVQSAIDLLASGSVSGEKLVVQIAEE